ncbi:hypothetical protein KC349_g245 [Hortaea werneckii]|nr:hypothetical protein KC349_g245 [Hortaea werneckii]
MVLPHSPPCPIALPSTLYTTHRRANPWLIAVVDVRALYAPSTFGPPKAVQVCLRFECCCTRGLFGSIQEASFGIASFVPRNCQFLKSGGAGVTLVVLRVPKLPLETFWNALSSSTLSLPSHERLT